MAGALQMFACTCCIVIIFNAVIIAVKVILFLGNSNRLIPTQNDSLCSCTCRHYATVHYYKPFDYTVTLPRLLLSRKLLARVGSDLDFDYNLCPHSSVMLDPVKQNAPPLHEDCPLLFIIGAHKAGTTSLYQYLTRHSGFRGIRVDKGPLSGETYHFTSKYTKESWETYKLHFPTSAFSGEKSTGMLHTCEAPKWLYESCGRMSKVIILLRNPTQRYVSAMENRQPRQVHIQALFDIQTYHEASQKQAQTHFSDVKCINEAYSTRNHLYMGFYSLHLTNWLCNFPSENILLLNSEEFNKSPAEILQLVVEFVNLEPFDDYKLNVVANITYNNGRTHWDKYTGSELRETYEILDKTYRNYNKELFRILRWNSSIVDWPS